MLSAMPRARFASVPIVLVVLATLSGCASEPPHALQDSKSQVQLVRNAAAERIPVDAIAAVVNAVDTSTACGEGDPYRQWNSTVIVSLSENGIASSAELYAELVASYAGEGWVTGSATDTFTSLRHADRGISLAVATLTVAEKPSLRVEVIGDCVLTGGENSAEVKALEGR